MKPINTGGHSAYQERVLAQLRKYYPDADTSFDAATWEIMEQFWNLDLSPVDQIMQDRYSKYRPPPRLPSDLLRSYLLSLEFKIASITLWASQLKQNYLMPFFLALRLVIRRVLVPSTTFLTGSGLQIKATFPIPCIHQRRNPKSQRRREKKLRRSIR